MYWTPAKMLLLADVAEYSFTYAVKFMGSNPQQNTTNDVPCAKFFWCTLQSIIHIMLQKAKMAEQT